MVLPPLNLAPPDIGEFPEIRFNEPDFDVTPGPNPSPNPKDDPQLVYRGAVRAAVRNELMNPSITAILAKQTGNQTLSGDEQNTLQAWEDIVEAEYARRIGFAVPPDVQRRLEALDKLNEDKSSGGGGKSGGGGGGGGAKKGGGGAGGGGAPPPGGARPPTGAAGAAARAAAAGQPKALSAAAQQNEAARLNHRKQLDQRAEKLLRKATEITLLAETRRQAEPLWVDALIKTGMTPEQAAAQAKIEVAKIDKPQKPMTDEMYSQMSRQVGTLIAKPGGPAADPTNHEEVVAAQTLKNLGRLTWADQMQRGEINKLSPEDRQLLADNRLLTAPDAQGNVHLKISTPQDLAAMSRLLSQLNDENSMVSQRADQFADG
jgi:hypothetical protein